MKHVVLDGRYAQMLRAFGVDPVAALRLARLPEGTFLEESPKVSVEECYALMSAVGELVPDERTIVAMASAEGVERFSPPVFAAWGSPDGRTCVSGLTQYKRLVGPLTLNVTEADGALTVSLEPEIGTGRELPRLVVLTELVLITHLLRAATGRRVVPVTVTMRDPCPPGGAVVAFLGATPVPGAGDSVTFGSQDVSAPFVTHNDAMWAYVEPEMRRRLSDLGAGQSVAARVCCPWAATAWRTWRACSPSAPAPSSVG